MQYIACGSTSDISAKEFHLYWVGALHHINVETLRRPGREGTSVTKEDGQPVEIKHDAEKKVTT